jgi:hypothetical protein
VGFIIEGNSKVAQFDPPSQENPPDVEDDDCGADSVLSIYPTNINANTPITLACGQQKKERKNGNSKVIYTTLVPDEINSNSEANTWCNENHNPDFSCMEEATKSAAIANCNAQPDFDLTCVANENGQCCGPIMSESCNIVKITKYSNVVKSYPGETEGDIDFLCITTLEASASGQRIAECSPILPVDCPTLK